MALVDFNVTLTTKSYVPVERKERNLQWKSQEHEQYQRPKAEEKQKQDAMLRLGCAAVACDPQKCSKELP